MFGNNEESMLQILEEVEGNKDLDDLVIESKLNTFE